MMKNKFFIGMFVAALAVYTLNAMEEYEKMLKKLEALESAAPAQAQPTRRPAERQEREVFSSSESSTESASGAAGELEISESDSDDEGTFVELPGSDDDESSSSSSSSSSESSSVQLIGAPPSSASTSTTGRQKRRLKELTDQIYLAASNALKKSKRDGRQLFETAHGLWIELKKEISALGRRLIPAERVYVDRAIAKLREAQRHVGAKIMPPQRAQAGAAAAGATRSSDDQSSSSSSSSSSSERGKARATTRPSSTTPQAEQFMNNIQHVLRPGIQAIASEISNLIQAAQGAPPAEAQEYLETAQEFITQLSELVTPRFEYYKANKNQFSQDQQGQILQTFGSYRQIVKTYQTARASLRQRAQATQPTTATTTTTSSQPEQTADILIALMNEIVDYIDNQTIEKSLEEFNDVKQQFNQLKSQLSSQDQKRVNRKIIETGQALLDKLNEE